MPHAPAPCRFPQPHAGRLSKALSKLLPKLPAHILLTLLAVCLLCLTACEDTGREAGTNRQQASGQPRTELVFASTKDIRDINPHLYGGEMAAQGMVFEALVRNTATGIEPGLATSWDISADGKVYTFYLRHNVRFTDGTPFNAEAVRLNVEAVLANRLRHAWLDLVNEIERCEVVDEYTVRLVLKHPYYPTLVELGLLRPFRFLSPQCFVNNGTKDGVSGLVGTGPWILREHAHNQYALFVRNADYWGEQPALSAVRWKVLPDHQAIVLALQKGEIDLLFGADGDMINLDTFAALEARGQYVTRISNPVASRALLVNTARPFTGEKAVRLALQHAINREELAAGVLNGTESVADTLLAPTVRYCNVPLERRGYDPALAGRLLDEAGWIPGVDGVRAKDSVRATMRLSYNANNAQERTIGEFVQADLQRIGVELRLLGEEKQAFLDRQKSGDFELQYSLSWGTPYDPQSYLSSWRIPAHGDYKAQQGLARKAWLDSVISALMIEPDESARQAMYRDILTYIHNEGVYIPISYSRTKAVHVRSLQGVDFGLSQYEIPFEKMSFAPAAGQ